MALKLISNPALSKYVQKKKKKNNNNFILFYYQDIVLVHISLPSTKFVNRPFVLSHDRKTHFELTVNASSCVYVWPSRSLNFENIYIDSKAQFPRCLNPCISNVRWNDRQ